jgi:hypothetical protein
MSILRRKPCLLLVGPLLLFLLLLLASCGPAVTRPATQQNVTINPTFQAQTSPIPTVPPYRCGAWTSNNAPGPNGTITVYARITKNGQGVPGAVATGVVHFQDGDQQFAEQPTSDLGGYVQFLLPLQGRQPINVPATISISFSNIAGKAATLACTPAFFTPQGRPQQQQGN